jgi:hypothetical protein
MGSIPLAQPPWPLLVHPKIYRLRWSTAGTHRWCHPQLVHRKSYPTHRWCHPPLVHPPLVPHRWCIVKVINQRASWYEKIIRFKKQYMGRYFAH